MKTASRILAFACLSAVGFAVSAGADPADDKAAVTGRLQRWADAFNDRDAAGTCDLFAPDLISTVPGGLDDDRNSVCAWLSAILAKTDTRFHYSPEIREIIVSGDYAAVRLIWTLTTTRGSHEDKDQEAGMDIFQRQPDGRWSIIRFMAFSTKLSK